MIDFLILVTAGSRRKTKRRSIIPISIHEQREYSHANHNSCTDFLQKKYTTRHDRSSIASTWCTSFQTIKNIDHKQYSIDAEKNQRINSHTQGSTSSISSTKFVSRQFDVHSITTRTTKHRYQNQSNGDFTTSKCIQSICAGFPSASIICIANFKRTNCACGPRNSKANS